ncbi:hypothetical protein ABZ793_23025 [Micromonospora sp. NPDC047465]|uniref:hypothetical protein n=1 Tax=Micromonospora sp. NPDC047465 TaxID=3154813 RepID=UPI0033DBC362
MRVLAEPTVLLTAWEEAAAVPAAARAAVLVHRAGLAPDLDAALDLSIGQCAALALAAHAAAFGRDVDVVFPCTSCGARLEAELHLPDPAETDPGALVGAVHPDRVDDLTVHPLTIRDLLAAATGVDGRALLFSRCVRRADGTSAVPTDLSPAQREAVDAAADRLAGFAALALRMTCPSCGDDVRVALDPDALLWDQVDAAAPALLDEVATLARAFGWDEATVLALSPARRGAYLERAAR